ncbi:MAG: succinoglycan biosynthesis protein ExoH [Arenicella sp.]|jgi:succinoglycan biosynthesis protein ExoH
MRGLDYQIIMEKQLNIEISKRIWVTRYFMVIGIIVLHLPPYQLLSEIGPSIFDYIRAFFSHGLFRATVPMLTVLSGFLIFQFNLHLQPFELLSKKVKSVLVPLIIWNIPFVIAIYISQKYSVISHEFTAILYPFDSLSWINALTGLFGPPANYPLHFLRDLFAVSLLSPIYWLFLKRRPYFGLAVVLAVYYFNLDSSFVLRNSMLVSFYIGALAATQKWSLTCLDKHAKLLFFVFIAFCAVIVLSDIQSSELFRLVSPFLVWPSMSLIINTKLYEFLYNNSKSSFFTFLSHGPIILILWLLFKKSPADIPYYVYWLLALPVTVYMSIYLSKSFKNFLPRISSIVLGGR